MPSLLKLLLLSREIIPDMKTEEGTLLDRLSGRKVILGSGSPRRRELLAGLGLEFTVDASSHTKEEYDPSAPHEEIARTLAVLKSDGFHRPLEDDELLITADTLVLCGEEILGKPRDREDAYRMLKLLSGRTHQVVTGVCLRDTAHSHSFACISDVTFREMTDSEIYYYIDHYHPYDKAGAYGIQEWIGYAAISGIRGSYFNIVGLPVQMLYVELCGFCGGKKSFRQNSLNIL